MVHTMPLSLHSKLTSFTQFSIPDPGLPVASQVDPAEIEESHTFQKALECFCLVQCCF